MVPLQTLRMLVLGRVFGTGTATPKTDAPKTEGAAQTDINVLTKGGQILREKTANELIQITDPSNKIGKYCTE